MRTLNKVYIVLFFAIILTSCAEKKPPHYGAFIKNRNDLIEIAQIDIVDIPDATSLQGIKIAPESQPTIVLWQQNTILDYLQFMSIATQEKLNYDAVPTEYGAFELKPVDVLAPGQYCYIQGNPTAAILPAWCFQVTGDTVNRQAIQPTKTNDLPIIPALAEEQVLKGLSDFEVILKNTLLPLQPVAYVDGKPITTMDFLTMVRYKWLTYLQQYWQYEQFAQYFGSDPNSLSYIQSFMAQIRFQMEPANLGQSAIDDLVANAIITEEARQRGITVTEAEITQAFQSYFSFYPDGTPTSTAARALAPTSTLNPTQIALIGSSAMAATQAAMSTPTSSASSVTPMPTFTPYTTQAYGQDLSTFLPDIYNFVYLTEADLRWVFGMQLLRQKVFNAVTADTPREQDQVWLRQIVSGTQDQAESVYSRLQNGEDFIALAEEVMSGGSSTIDLGWFGTGTLDASAEMVVWSLNLGQVSEPLQTSNGWIIYQVLGHEIRALTDTQYSTLQQTNFQNWLDRQKASVNIQILDIWKSLVTASSTTPTTATP